MGNTLNLRQRILFGYVVPLMLMVGVAFAVYSGTQRLQALSAATMEAARIVTLAKETHMSLARYQRDMRGYLLTQDPAMKQAANRSMSSVAENLRTLSVAMATIEAREAFARLQTTVDQMVRAGHEYGQLVDAGDVVKAARVFGRSNLGDISTRIDTLIDEIEALELAELARRSTEQEEAARGLVLLAVGATVAAILLAVVIGRVLADRIARTISGSVGQLSVSSTEIAATMNEHERTVSQQVAAVSQVSATVEELGMSARQSANQAESSAASAMRALDLTQDGYRSAGEAAQRTADMKEKIDSLARQILSLSEQAGQIGGIAKLVGELASETNMLALNAAVEAARAGEQGKGFAVVASEIRKLAVQSKKSAERADALVAEIQKATNSAVMVTEDGSRSADHVMTTANEVAKAFDAIAGAANEVSENAQQVMLNSKQQAAALNQVTDAMQSLAAGSRQMAAGTEQTKVGIESLKQVALGLKALV